MAEIFFIANDERILQLIEILRPQIQQSITFQTDIVSAMHSLPEDNPELIFVEDGIDGAPSEELAREIRTVAYKESVQLVLLSDDWSAFQTIDSLYECSLDIDLPLKELSHQILQLLPARLAPALGLVADDEDLLFHDDDRTEFWLPNLGQDSLEPHPLPPAEPENDEELRLDIVNNGFSYAPLSTEQAAKTADGAARTDEEIDFFILEHNEADPEPPSSQIEPEPVAAKAAPPPLPSPPPTEPQRAVEPALETGPASAPAEKKHAPKSLYPTLEQIYRSPPEVCGLHSETEATKEGLQSALAGKKPFAWVMGISAVIFICLAFVVLQWRQVPEKEPTAKASPAKALPAPAATPQAAAAPSATEPLPKFIPRVAADAGYAATHPGWELYRQGSLQFRVFREAGRIRAVQVVNEGDAGIPLSLVHSSCKEATGSELPATGSAREQDGIRTETRSLADGAEVAIYRDVAQGRIRGFVLQLPLKGRK